MNVNVYVCVCVSLLPPKKKKKGEGSWGSHGQLVGLLLCSLVLVFPILYYTGLHACVILLLYYILCTSIRSLILEGMKQRFSKKMQVILHNMVIQNC